MNSMIRFVGLLVVVSICLPLSAASFDFSSFNSSNVGQLQLNPGSSAAQATPVFTSANALALLTGVQTNVYDSVFFKTPQDITTFTTTFVIQVIPGNAVSNEADGFVFTLQTTGSAQTTVPDGNGNLVDGGSGLGYAGFPGKSVGVAFNYFAGPNGVTLGYNIVTNGGNPAQQNGGYTSYAPINLNSQDFIQITITYIGGSLFIVMHDLTHSAIFFNSQPTSIDIPHILGKNNAYVGFTAAAGADKSKLYLFAWSCGPYGNGGGSGDPVFSGFQGQEFQFHGLPDEHFNLITSPDVQLNAHFVYLSSGKCDYNDTACYTHPGTYMDILGLSVGETQVKLVSGPHAAGMRVWVDDEEISRGEFRRSLSNHTSASLIFHKHGKVSIHTTLIKFEVANSDMFMNIAVSLANQELLHVGAKKHTVTDEKICKSNAETHDHELIETTVSKKYSMTTPLHGLIGQTWRNVKVCGRDWMGTVQDYLVTSLFGQDYHYNYFQY